MNEALFKNLDRENDSLWIVKEFFNSINNIFFLRTIAYLVEGTSFGDEYSDCDFPDEVEDEESFEGVRFRFYDDEIVVSEETFKECVSLACKRYEEIHPDKSSEINELLSRVSRADRSNNCPVRSVLTTRAERD